jgi:hypothetical protein
VLAELYRAFEPDEVVERHSWLFAASPRLLDGEREWTEGYQQALSEARTVALREIHRKGGLEGIIEAAFIVESAGQLGFTLGLSTLFTGVDEASILLDLASENASRAEFARGFLFGVGRQRGRDWIEAIPIHSRWSAAQRVVFLEALPRDSRTWDIAEALGPDVERIYWSQVTPYGVGDALAERALRKLLQYDQLNAALALAAHPSRVEQSFPEELLFKTLEAILRAPSSVNWQGHALAYDVSTLLDLLASSVDTARVARLEWGFLPLLGPIGPCQRKPRLLHLELAGDPSFFAQVIALAFRRDGDDSSIPLDREELARVEVAGELLESWKTIPGTSAEGVFDPLGLMPWIESARRMCADTGHQGAADQIIGGVLTSSSEGEDGAWPHPAVRNAIDAVSSPKMERAFAHAIFRSRGVYSPDGGTTEREIARRYTNWATAITDSWPRTAALMRSIAREYEEDARREAREAELRHDLGR